ncbi:accessory gene regulator B family protein [Ruminiclostridium herbifermentans]|uniref:Accessory gene regulator B family protein n=1 Tax=Ruminiclostridium herbifermentans TaxID=2488810 RepID=A0A4U7JAJ5_9FIRM|nr:accessory gene regulator B family protein [Ruminiclostridium herbifermentans]QNU65629.1 accessory gene regulator B family protein [Ruminiclostridium herbifermentans]
MKIIRRFAYSSAVYIQKNNNGNHENRRILYFGFQAIYGDIIKLIIVILISSALKSLLQVLALTFAFVLLRRYAGGFHMDTEGKCIISTVCSFVIPGTLISKISFEFNTVWIIIIIAVAFVICLFLLKKYAPKDCVNRPIEEDEAAIFKRKAIRDVIILIIISIILAILGQHLLSLSIVAGILIEIFTLVPVGYRLFERINSWL